MSNNSSKQHTDASRLERICNIVLQLQPESDSVGLRPNSLGGLQRLAQSALDASRADRSAVETDGEQNARELLQAIVDSATSVPAPYHGHAMDPVNDQRLVSGRRVDRAIAFLKERPARETCGKHVIGVYTCTMPSGHDGPCRHTVKTGADRCGPKNTITAAERPIDDPFEGPDTSWDKP